MFDKYLRENPNYIPNNLVNACNHIFDDQCIFTIGESNNFVQFLDLCRNDIKSINEPYPNDKAVYFIFKNGVSEPFEIVADNIPKILDPECEDFDTSHISVKCTVDENFLNQHNIKICPYLDFNVQLKIILTDNSIVYTEKKDIKIITTLDHKID